MKSKTVRAGSIAQGRTSPNPVSRSRRAESVRVLTSGKAGKVFPVAAIPLLREDAVNGRISLRCELAETAAPLANGVNVVATAVFVPMLAAERFSGIDELNRAYSGKPESDDTVTPYFSTMTVDSSWRADGTITAALGIHANIGDTVNAAFVEAYEIWVNYQRSVLSPALSSYSHSTSSLALAACPWNHGLMKYIVPDYDAALLQGEVALNLASAKMPVSGLGAWQSNTDLPNLLGETPHDLGTRVGAAGNPGDGISVRLTDGVVDVFAELAENGISVSLANIDVAKRTAAFARIRQQYQHLDDDAVIDLLMSGINMPDQALRQPIVVARQKTLFGFSTRFSSDADALDKSVTTGVTQIDLNVRVPRQNTGGVILVTLEVTPEQMFERQRDKYLYTTEVAGLPEFVRDSLDADQVSIVSNSFIDNDHSDPDGVFGYAPLNFEWQRNTPHIGGKFYRPEADATFDEDRQRIWAVETVDPTLTEDFYLCTNMHQNVFADTEADAFEVLARGEFMIEGNTVFGPALLEATDDYDTISEQADLSQIEKD